MDERQERVLVSTHALVATDGVRFRTISGAQRRRPVRRARIIEPPSSFPSNNLEELPSPQLITFLRVHDHPVRMTPVSQHRPTQRPVHTAPILYAAAVTTAKPSFLRVHDHPVHTAPVSQHRRWRIAYVAALACATPRVHRHSFLRSYRHNSSQLRGIIISRVIIIGMKQKEQRNRYG
jgi:hypothetical protein